MAYPYGDMSNRHYIEKALHILENEDEFEITITDNDIRMSNRNIAESDVFTSINEANPNTESYRNK